MSYVAKTIARTATKRIAAIKARDLVCHSRTLYYNFIAQEVPSERVLRVWAMVESGDAKLIDHETGRFTIRVHSNEWYELAPRA